MDVSLPQYSEKLNHCLVVPSHKIYTRYAKRGRIPQSTDILGRHDRVKLQEICTNCEILLREE